jgi:DUF4097 and DUF4098 domain-containing protein YvlB
VSGDVEIEGRLDPSKEHRFKTISGDVDLALAEADATIEYRTASGDIECELPARIVRHGRKEYGVVIGGGRGHVGVKTVSGDLTVRGTSASTPDAAQTEESAADEAAAADVERTQPMDTSSREEVRSVLERPRAWRARCRRRRGCARQRSPGALTCRATKASRS